MFIGPIWRWQAALCLLCGFALAICMAFATEGQGVALAMGVVTWAVLDKRIDAGRGQGHFDDYLPWLWIHRKNTSGQGNQVVDPLPGYRRASHFMAQVEWHVALLCIYLGARDVREQFPLWPWAHEHPLADYPGAQHGRRRRCAGLLDIADHLGIDHGREVGSEVPYVASLDLLVTVQRRNGIGLAGIALKPHDLILSAEPNDRVNERLQLEVACMNRYDATHVVVDRRLLGPHTGGNLEFFSSGYRIPSALQVVSLQGDFLDRFLDIASTSSISEGINRAARGTGLDQMSANLLWRHLVWRQRIDIDITAPLELGRPLRGGGKDIARAISRELFGEEPK
jgi:hypothetical protein